MFEADVPVVGRAELAAANGSVIELLDRLRALSLADFAELMWLLPMPQLPNISGLLPRMASAEAQLGWTGKAGDELRQHTVDFCRIVALHYQAIRGRRLGGERIFDFGFGYGRIARVMYWFTNPDRYYGVDPMQQSLDICREDGVLGTFVKVDYVPAALPSMGTSFDLLFAYSVFTHTSAHATRAGLRNLRAVAHGHSVLAITIRPVEHWNFDTSAPVAEREARIAEHRQSGFAFRPHNVTDSHGDHIYGENSMTPEWIEANNPEWKVVSHDRGLDPFQTILFLVPS